MSILRTIKCNVEGCREIYTEQGPGAGFPGWGVLQGRQNEKGETECHLCPKHLDMVFKYVEEVK
jgi:hypothetical protein